MLVSKLGAFAASSFDWVAAKMTISQQEPYSIQCLHVWTE